jgi:uncharacterized membrane protein
MRGPTQARMERRIGMILRTGVSLAAAIILLGGLQFLARHGGDPADHRTFRSEPGEPRGILAIVRDTLHPSGRALIQLGVLLLVATPVARVVFSLAAFAAQRDTKFLVITGVVLGILAFGLFGPTP